MRMRALFRFFYAPPFAAAMMRRLLRLLGAIRRRASAMAANAAIRLREKLRLWRPMPPYACAKSFGYGGQCRHTPARKASAMAANAAIRLREKLRLWRPMPPYACAGCAMCSSPSLPGRRLARIRAAAALWHFRCHTRGNRRAADPGAARVSSHAPHHIAPKAQNPGIAKNKKMPRLTPGLR